ncbi:hypothetical protein P7K49_007732 [Saguinus oedipus]|uniref:MHC class II beta chain N-terminal domain-containing protein n=1 Tax=Saguinus oedipus TaxID=9490 RepID=A0ABQ9VWH4_SAGOE|nr:hypothetical protein P7K49_007732 [Saguinus oedipus]
MNAVGAVEGTGSQEEAARAAVLGGSSSSCCFEDEALGCTWWGFPESPAPGPGSPDGGVAVGVFPRGRPCDRIVCVPTARFLEYSTSECHHFNGTERVRFLDRYFHNQEEFLRFDSDVWEYPAVTERGRRSAEHFNSRKELHGGCAGRARRGGASL